MFSYPVAVAADIDDMTVVHETIDQGPGHHFIPNTAENPQIRTSDVCDQGDGFDPSLVRKDAKVTV